MATNRNANRRQDPLTYVNFRAPKQLREAYRELAARDERTLSQALRRHMAETVERSKQAA